MTASIYSGYRFPRDVIQRAVWMYLRFTLSYRDVEDLLAECGIEVSYETVRRWVFAFGPVAQASECDEVVGRHMAGQAMLAAQFIASAEKGGMTADQINAVLKNIAANSAIEEF
jgi:hypothetical protein